jgi:hypothetical protein
MHAIHFIHLLAPYGEACLLRGFLTEPSRLKTTYSVSEQPTKLLPEAPVWVIEPA